MNKKVLFIDRDGTILVEPSDRQIDAIEKMEFYPGVISTLRKIACNLKYELVMISNQDGLGTELFPEDTFWPVQNLMLKVLKNEGVEFDAILVDPTLPHENAPTRKPGTGMLIKYMQGDYDLCNSYVIGDRQTDVQLARNLGTKAILLGDGPDDKAVLVTKDWDDIYNFLYRPPRKATIRRTTSETDVQVTLNLDGHGTAKVSTGIGFFDHMLELFSCHSSIDLSLMVKGDLYVDEHHMVEDTALALGDALYKALGDKRGIERYGFLLPMEDSIAEVAIDFSGRPYLKWEVEFKREKIGNFPTEMFVHFFKSLTDNARCGLYIKAQGENEHHKIESIFKAVARSIKMAVQRNAKYMKIPSTKGIL